MSIKGKLFGVAISILTVAGGAIYFAAPASANAAEVYICAAHSYSGITGVWQCANAVDVRGFAINFAGENNATETNGASLWHAPTNGDGQISLVATTKYCMSLDYGNDNNAVKNAACAGASNEEWKPVEDSSGYWVYYNKEYPTYCLNYDPYPSPPVLNAVKCPSSPGNNQQFLVSTIVGSG
jgi:hypothetical protein